ncbi:rRNA pseudouridine synthase [bacterium]|nr:rRNA pseudouridine synthase [bacterium]
MYAKISLMKNPGTRNRPKPTKTTSDRKNSSGFLWLAMNKPAEATTTRKEDMGRRTVYDLLPPNLPRVESVGRLDRATTGLLLFTNEFKLGQALLNPENEIPRVYRVVTNRPLPEQALPTLRQGVLLQGGTICQPIKIQKNNFPTPGRSYVFTLQEGKYREVRRLVMHFGRTVRGLHRLTFGPIELGNLKPGQVRRLPDWEINKIRKMIK